MLTWLSNQYCPADPDGDLVLPRGRVVFPGGVANVEVARTVAHRTRGLMYRQSLPANGGMLFAWPRDEVREMWMHNTCVAIDMVFIRSDGRVVGVISNVPPLNDRFRSVTEPVAYVLEVNAGWARRHGVRAGQYAAVEGA